MATSDFLLSIAAIVISVAGLIPLYMDYFHRRTESALTFILQKFQETVKEPIASNWSIRILHPNKLVEKCQIFWNEIPLPWWDSPEERIFQRTIVVGGGGNVRVPEGLELGDATITVKDGKKKLKARKFSDIPVARR